jgi:hypothetical protein
MKTYQEIISIMPNDILLTEYVALLFLSKSERTITRLEFEVTQNQIASCKEEILNRMFVKQS